MNTAQTRAVLTVAMMAAFADGLKDDRERTRIRELASRLPAEGIHLAALYQEVLLGKPELGSVVQPLAAEPALAQFAYEMAVGVVDADGAHTAAEGAFLAKLAGALGLTYDWYGSCKVERCLTAPYWNWGPIYAKIAQGVADGTYTPGWDYFDGESGALGLYGFMEGQELTPGVADLPPEVVSEVKDLMAKNLAGEFTRFDVFSGEIKDNKGNVIVPAGEKMVQADLDQFPPGAPGLECKYCMKWWADGITAELPDTGN